MVPLVEKELDRLVVEGIIEPVQFADTAALILPVLKQDKVSVRICDDLKLPINQASKVDQYPIPRIEDLFAKLVGGKYFTYLDLSQAYQQLLLDDESKDYIVINTPLGLFRHYHSPFEVSSASEIFQRAMEPLLQGIQNVVVYIDDILVTGTTDKVHLNTLNEVLNRLKNAGLHLIKASAISCYHQWYF